MVLIFLIEIFLFAIIAIFLAYVCLIFLSLFLSQCFCYFFFSLTLLFPLFFFLVRLTLGCVIIQISLDVVYFFFVNLFVVFVGFFLTYYFFILKKLFNLQQHAGNIPSYRQNEIYSTLFYLTYWYEIHRFEPIVIFFHACNAWLTLFFCLLKQVCYSKLIMICFLDM